MDQISPANASMRFQGNLGKIIVLDCRESVEVDIASISGALHIPMAEIPDRLEELDRDSEIIVFCHHGVRSHQVALFLEDQGYPRVTNLIGGIDAWSVEVDPEVPRY